MVLRAVMTGQGAALPERAVSNSELPAHLETSDAWIRERTGITQRYLAAEGETTSSLATAAAKAALADAGLEAQAVDLILLATSTPDRSMPSTACLVQAGLGNHYAAALDLNAACSGFVYGLSLADAMIRAQQARCVLLIGADVMSRLVDWNDRSSCVLFGDGAGAVILQAQEQPEDGPGILGCRLFADGAAKDILYTDGGVSTTQTAGYLRMEGREVFRHAVDNMTAAFEGLLSGCGLSTEAIDRIIPHQANARIIRSIARKAGLAEDRFVITVDRHANTSAASIPLALEEARRSGQVKKGEIVAFPALGAGLTWGCCIIRL